MCKRFTILIATLIFALWSGVCLAADKAGDEEEKRPLTILHASLSVDSSEFNNVKYRCTIWLRNVSHRDVDGIKLKLVMRDGSKIFYEKEKEVEDMHSGKRVFVNYKWEDLKDRKVIPELWLTYKQENGQEKKLQVYAASWEN